MNSLPKTAAIPVIAIDGPAGVGKSTVARLLAKTLGYNILISGVLYRVLAMQLHEHGIAFDARAEIAALVANTDIKFVLDGEQVKTYINGTIAGRDIYGEHCAQLASAAGESAALREALLPIQRQFRQPPGLVADGRDMATVVFTDAVLKLFLQADIAERARRRQRQLRQRKVYAKLGDLNNELLERDQRDSERSIAQLKIADDAVVLDTTTLSVTEVVDKLMKVVDAKLNERGKTN